MTVVAGGWVGASSALPTGAGAGTPAFRAAPSNVAVALGDAAYAGPKPKRPKIVRHADVRAEATSPSGAVVTYRPATVRRARSVRYSKASGTLFPLGTTVVTIVARNRAGSTRSTFKVTVVDTTSPALAAQGDLSAEARSSAGATVTYGPINATDVVSPGVSATCSPASGSVFPLGTTTVTCTVRDAAGNNATGSFRVKVVDTTAPTLQLSDVTVPPSGVAGASVTYGPIKATDLVDSTVAVSCSPASGGLFPIGTTTITCSARDAAGNSATGTFKIVVLPAKVGHYSGTTSQGKAVSFDVSSDGRRIANLSVDVSAPCSDSSTITGTVTSTGGVFIGSNAAFSLSAPGTVSGVATGTLTSTFAGSFGSAVSAAGTFRAQASLTSPAGVQCDTGTISWTASTTG